ncbi:MAG: hypothetical protein FWC20_02985 [Oscillospiraceae bacterium]|nr:hypothetical protein [Oscillospiraceae bacterium]MCL2278356.1 hypothetical protein [Oscillospiraceae bacterium]
MLYKKRMEKALTDSLFRNPTSEYRGAPFWSWNCKLEEEELLRQIDIFKEMGIGGFHIHSRSGLATPYMGDEFMKLAVACNHHATQNEMLCFLYDEDRWPSGAAGGTVTKEDAYRMRFLVFCPYDYDFSEHDEIDSAATYVSSGNRKHLARYKITLENGILTHYEKMPIDTKPDCTDDVWDAYLEISGNSPWFNNEAYVNTLDKKAIDRFIEVTHEKYHKWLGDEFGKSIPSIFTDEPQFSHKDMLTHSEAKTMVTLPFTDDFDETYRAAYGASVFDTLPEIIWETENVSKSRYRYHDHVCTRFTEAFADNVGAWCDSKGIMLTGHMMHEESLTSQTKALGETMRAYRAFRLPGIDMLCDNREYTTAKQAQSAARQYGREGVLSELYGVTNWDFDFRGHKLQGDWQAALGVTVRVHHLTWVSMAGEAKRDYPASIGYQSPWHKEYSYVEDHFARVNTALVRGKPIARVAVIHPIEGFWMHYGPNDKTSSIRAEMETDFENIIKWLLFGHIDFDFVSESLLPELFEEHSDKFVVGQMAYDTVLVPNCRSLRSSTLSAIKSFSSRGGKVFFAGTPAEIIDGEKADIDMSSEFICIPFSKTAVLEALEDFRDVQIQSGDGKAAKRLIYQMRQDGDDRWLFVCNGTKPKNKDIPKPDDVTISVKGLYTPTLYNTLDGSTSPMAVKYRGDTSVIERTMDMQDSLLIKLSPGKAPDIQTQAKPPEAAEASSAETRLLTPHSFELSEPNVLVLDIAEYAFDDGAWQSADELLRIDNRFREILGYPMRAHAWAQPWVSSEAVESANLLKLRFTISSQVHIADGEIYLALEGLRDTKITFNGQCVESKADGWYVDRAIQKVKFPELAKGDNELLLEIDFKKAANVENCFLLGRFGVEVKGKKAEIIEYPEKLPFGDLRQMGLPFYGGNVTYNCHITSTGKPLRLEATYFRAPLLKVNLNGKPIGRVAYAPYSLDLGELPKGQHEVKITAYGNRFNTFGAIHNSNETVFWHGPDSWRTKDAEWSYEYRLKPTGILKSPEVKEGSNFYLTNYASTV